MSVFLALLLTLRNCARSRAVLQIEVLALRHQLEVLKQSRPQRLRLAPADRLLWVWLSRVWKEWRPALVIVKPETVIAWHRRGFRAFWRWRSRRRLGRPSVPLEVRALIRTMSDASPRWGAPRIHGELLKLGSSRTIGAARVDRRVGWITTDAVVFTDAFRRPERDVTIAWGFDAASKKRLISQTKSNRIRPTYPRCGIENPQKNRPQTHQTDPDANTGLEFIL